MKCVSVEVFHRSYISGTTITAIASTTTTGVTMIVVHSGAHRSRVYRMTRDNIWLCVGCIGLILGGKWYLVGHSLRTACTHLDDQSVTQEYQMSEWVREWMLESKYAQLGIILLVLQLFSALLLLKFLKLLQIPQDFLFDSLNISYLIYYDSTKGGLFTFQL